MAFLDWRASFSVSNSRMDADHQRLFEIINELHEGILAQRGRVELGPILEELLDYTRRHFSAEELLMETANYPDLAAHKRAHQGLLARVQEMDQAHRQGEREAREAVPQAFAFLLKDWLTEHILEMDRAYAPYLARR